MKKIQIVTFLAILAMVVVMILNSCTKQEDAEVVLATEDVKDYTVFNKISYFAEKMTFYKENPNYKDGESLNADEAMWLMEGAVNLTYGFPFEDYGEFTSADATLIVQKNQDGKIDMDVVAVRYQQLIDEAREDYYNSGFDDKGLYIVILEKTEETDYEVSFNVETVTGNKGIDPYPFNIGDNWWYGEYGGGCAGNTQPGLDAAHELVNVYPKYDMNECMALAGPKSVEVTGGEEWLRRPNDPKDNYNDYYIFCMNNMVVPFNHDDDLCLMSNEMSTYYWELDYVITDLAREHENIPQGYSFINFKDVQGNFILNLEPPNETLYFHYFELMYALPYAKPDCNYQPIEL